jgi:hypothetical protein
MRRSEACTGPFDAPSQPAAITQRTLVVTGIGAAAGVVCTARKRLRTLVCRRGPVAGTSACPDTADAAAAHDRDQKLPTARAPRGAVDRESRP